MSRNDSEETENEEIESLKVVLIGESGVGKTSIINQFAKGIFNQDIMSTNGATFTTNKKKFIQPNGSTKNISFEMWDTAGQEKYRSLAKMFFKEASVALIVYDVTNLKSFNEIKNYWMNLVKEHAPKNIIMYIIGNKSDLIGSEAVKEEMAREYAKEEKVNFFLTSAKDRSGIDELFNEIGNKYLNPEYINSEENQQRILRKNEVAKVSKDSLKENQNKKKGCCG
jgi:small GTP-binding protein